MNGTKFGFVFCWREVKFAGVVPIEVPDVVIPHPDAIFPDICVSRGERDSDFSGGEMVWPSLAAVRNEDVCRFQFSNKTTQPFHLCLGTRRDSSSLEIEEMDICCRKTKFAG